MPVEDLEQEAETAVHKKSKKRRPVLCPRCGSEYMKRLRRVGFLQGKIYSVLGYYPWRCTKCLGDFMLRRRGAPRRHREHRPVE